MSEPPNQSRHYPAWVSLVIVLAVALILVSGEWLRPDEPYGGAVQTVSRSMDWSADQLRTSRTGYKHNVISTDVYLTLTRDEGGHEQTVSARIRYWPLLGYSLSCINVGHADECGLSEFFAEI